ncbi:hypothetical protein ILP92_01485 [Maribius pontilimi]|uniref:Uncharacterized protein n=1 Tax=Palleronia pontilimi TaxID=1964209 RepID=A0A934I732_9RHOB|nr:hypothetical protein [Palleronia pontilimi]MBJ3761423.1 hypothetical protein [Palleronia pontilimi]
MGDAEERVVGVDEELLGVAVRVGQDRFLVVAPVEGLPAEIVPDGRADDHLAIGQVEVFQRTGKAADDGVAARTAQQRVVAKARGQKVVAEKVSSPAAASLSGAEILPPGLVVIATRLPNAS